MTKYWVSDNEEHYSDYYEVESALIAAAEYCWEYDPVDSDDTRDQFAIYVADATDQDEDEMYATDLFYASCDEMIESTKEPDNKIPLKSIVGTSWIKESEVKTND